jgi:hypothetical protein
VLDVQSRFLKFALVKYCDVHAVRLRSQQRNYCFPYGLFRRCYLVTARHNNEEVFSTGSDPRLYNSEAVGSKPRRTDRLVVGRNVTLTLNPGLTDRLIVGRNVTLTLNVVQFSLEFRRVS